MKAYNYFPHDFNARNDSKLVELRMDMGNRGIGIYWSVIEMLYEEGGRIEIAKLKAVAFAINEELSFVQQVVQQYNLFECDDNFFWSKTVVARLKNIKKIREARVKAGKESGKQRLQNTAKEIKNQEHNDTNKCSTHVQHLLNMCSTDVQTSVRTKSNNIKEKEKENINKIETNTSTSSEEDVEELDKEKSCRVVRKYIEIWNNAVQGTMIPALRSLAGRRYDMFSARLKQYGENAVIEAINNISKSDFLKGNASPQGWHLTFDWFIKPSNFAKVLEGNYESPSQTNQTKQNDARTISNTEKQFQAGKSAFDRIMSGIEKRCNPKPEKDNDGLFSEESDYDLPG